MPYADPEQRRENNRRWREQKTKEGYGKALYARRAHRYRNEEILRAATHEAIQLLGDAEHEKAIKVLRKALKNAPPIGKPIEYLPEVRDK